MTGAAKHLRALMPDRATQREGAFARYPLIILRGEALNCVCPVQGVRYYSVPYSPEIPSRATAMAALLQRLSRRQPRAASSFHRPSR